MTRVLRYILLALLVLTAGCTRDPVAQSRQLVENGKRFVAKGKYKQASIVFRRALQKDAKNGEAYYQLGLVSLKLQAWPDAAAALRRAVSTMQDNEDAAVKLADLYWTAYASNPKQEQPLLTDIRELVSGIRKKNPKSFDGLRLAGYVALAENKLPEALQDFEAARQVKPNDPSLEYIYAQALAASGRLPDAEEVARQSVAKNKTDTRAYDFLFGAYASTKRMPEAENVLKMMADANPKNEAPLVKLAAFYYGTGRRPEMEASLARITSHPADFPMGRLTVGLFFARLRDFDRARKELEEGAKADVKSKATYQKAEAQLLAMQGKNGEAAGLVDSILKENPNDSQAVAMRASMLVASGSPEKIKRAVSDLQGLVAKKNDDPELRFQLAQAFIADKQPDQARVHLEEAIKRSRPGTGAAARVLLAQLMSAKGDNSKALALADEALKIDPNSYYAHLVRSSSLVALGKRDDAKAELQNILKTVPTSADAQYQLGYLTYQEQNFKDAEAIFRSLQQSSPKDPRAVIGIIETLVAEGKPQDAITILTAAIEREPDRPEYREALAMFSSVTSSTTRGSRNFRRLPRKRAP